MWTAPMLAKVPEITALFWVIKVLTTGMGEATGDYLAKINIFFAGAAGTIGFIVAMWWQLRTKRYIAAVYWFAVVMVAVFGTMVADGPHIKLGVSYVESTMTYGVLLAIVFYAWWRAERTLSIHSINTRRREVFYWLAVLMTFALGTATGDLFATTLHLGFFASAVLFAVLIAIPAIAWRLGLNPIAAFWIAYVLTRPLGASIADWLGKPHSFGGGLGFGDGTVAAVATVIIVALVGFVAVARNDIQPEPPNGIGGWPAPAGRAVGRHAAIAPEARPSAQRYEP
jgi:uncharacterized membrane-anchored protein